MITPDEIEALAQRVTARDIERVTAADISRAIHLLHIEGYVMGGVNNKKATTTTTPNGAASTIVVGKSKRVVDEEEVKAAVSSGETYSGGRPDVASSLIMGDLSLSKKKVAAVTGGEDVRKALLQKEGLVTATLASSQYSLGGHSILDASMKIMLREHKMKLVTKGSSDGVLRMALDAVNMRGTGMAYYWLVKEPHNQHAVLGYIPESWKVAVEGVAAKLLQRGRESY